MGANGVKAILGLILAMKRKRKYLLAMALKSINVYTFLTMKMYLKQTTWWRRLSTTIDTQLGVSWQVRFQRSQVHRYHHQSVVQHGKTLALLI